MDPLPHHYSVSAQGASDGPVLLSGAALANIESAPPAEFGGPGDLWSPETLLLAAVADCFVLSFRAVASASKFDWIELRCDTDGVLDRDEGVTRFKEVVNRVRLTLAAGGSEERANRLLQKAEDVCLISNSLNANIRLETSIEYS